ncbi:helicase-related protein [Pyrococcus kukulkanii]|uniref:helicase-related protein n=1 Tax=Pyrococcus kukulkanii TaxID=1609559 RepID=UPI003569EAB3
MEAGKMEVSPIKILEKYGLVDNRPKEVEDLGKKVEVKLIDILREVLTSGDYTQVDIAVGFLFLDGMREIQEELETFFLNGGKMRIVIGNQTNRETYEQLSMVYYSLEALKKIKERAKAQDNLEEQEEIIEKNANYLEQTLENEIFLRRLLEWLESGQLKIKIYIREFMHAKAYLFYSPTRMNIGLVGSSNFTLGGFFGNTELNALVQSTHFESLRRWFEEIWNEAVDFNPALLRIINESWAGQVPGSLPSPWEVFIRGLYELYKDVLDKERGFLLRMLEGVLYNFQRDAVKRAISIINKYGGVLISDVVGLGKSYIGLALLEHYSLLDLLEGYPREVAVIAPPWLVKYWENLLREFNIPGRVFSSGLLSHRERSKDKYEDMERYIRFVRTVLVDEAHHYTNPNTKSYKNLQELLMGKRVILLTATPYRKRYRDIINQIRLFRPERSHPFPITPQTWDDLTRAIEKGEVDPSYVLREIMIRRTRHDIIKLYGGQGNCIKVGRRKKLCFPERILHTLTYRISDVYVSETIPNEAVETILEDSDVSIKNDLYTLLLAGIQSMKYARFALYEYVHPRFRNTDPYRDLSSAGRALRGLRKILYLKRLESSWYALYKTLERDIIRTTNFIKFVENGFIPAGDEFEDILLGKIPGKSQEAKILSDEEVKEVIKEYKPTYKAGAFKVKELLSDLEYDLKKLKAMKEILEPLKRKFEANPKNDPKLAVLAEEILKMREKGIRKILIFSEFDETVQWIYRGLRDLLPELREKIAYVSSTSGGVLDKIRRFAPKANGYEEYISPEDEIDILISTDMLSEGLNLQDANVVINYDLHWTPIKLIQRIGRVDRIGTEHDTIHVYNFLPERELEENLKLVDKVKRRIAEFNKALGADGRILEETEEWNPSAIEAIYGAKTLEEIEVDTEKSLLSVTTLAEKLVREFIEENPEKFEKLKSRYSMRSIAKSKSKDYYAFFVLSNGVISQYMIYKYEEGKWKPQNIPIEVLVDITGLNEDTPPYNDEDAMRLYREVALIALGDFKKLLEVTRSELELSKKKPRYHKKVKEILHKLQILMNKAKSENEKRLIGEIMDLVKWGYLNHEPFREALLKFSTRDSAQKIFKRVQELIERYQISARRKRLREEKRKIEEGVKPHIVAGILFMPEG